MQALQGQPLLPETTRRNLRTLVLGVIAGRDPGKARAALLVALEAVAHCDIVDSLADALREETIYRGLVSVLAEMAEDDPDADRRRFARYNLARTHLAKAAQQVRPAQRRPYVNQAETALAGGGARSRDAAWVDLECEIAFLQDQVDQAISIATRLATITGNPSLASWRIADVQRRAGRLDAARKTLEIALAKTSDRRQWRHRLIQGLAWVEFDTGKRSGAAALLLDSAKVEQDSGRPFPLETNLARKLFQAGFRSEVAAYATRAADHLRGDPDAEDLLRLVRSEPTP